MWQFLTILLISIGTEMSAVRCVTHIIKNFYAYNLLSNLVKLIGPDDLMLVNEGYKSVNFLKIYLLSLKERVEFSKSVKVSCNENLNIV